MDMEKMNEQIQIIQDLVGELDADAQESEESLQAVWEWSQQLSGLVKQAMPHLHQKATEHQLTITLASVIESLINMSEDVEDADHLLKIVNALFAIIGELIGAKVTFEHD